MFISHIGRIKVLLSDPFLPKVAHRSKEKIRSCSAIQIKMCSDCFPGYPYDSIIIVRDKNMEQSRSQKLLKICSVIQFLTAFLFLLSAVFLFFVMKDESFYEQFKNDMKELTISTVKLFINAVILFVSSYILSRVSKDASRHNSALRITLIVIAYEIFNFITSLGVGVPGNLAAMVFSVIINMSVLYLISKVRKEYQEANN